MSRYISTSKLSGWISVRIVPLRPRKGQVDTSMLPQGTAVKP